MNVYVKYICICIYIHILDKDEHGRIRDQTTYIPTESPSGKICIALIYTIILQTFITIFIGSMLLPAIGTRFEINLTTDWQFRCY